MWANNFFAARDRFALHFLSGLPECYNIYSLLHELHVDLLKLYILTRMNIHIGIFILILLQIIIVLVFVIGSLVYNN